jgi:hypothetical protein
MEKEAEVSSLGILRMGNAPIGAIGGNLYTYGPLVPGTATANARRRKSSPRKGHTKSRKGAPPYDGGAYSRLGVPIDSSGSLCM